MLAGTIITAVTIPVYWGLYHGFGVIGLAWASNLAILMHTLTLAVLLHRRRLVALAGLNHGEIARGGAAAVVSFVAARLVLALLEPAQMSYGRDVLGLAVGGAVWAGCCVGGLKLLGSKLPEQMRARM